MSNNILPYYAFLPWVRKGLSNQITETDSKGVGGPEDERTTVAVDLKVSGQGGTTPSDSTVSKTLNLVGPGDVTGLNSNAVIKTEPVKNAVDFEPNYLASIEFYDEDFAWRYTPAMATTDKQLTPWLFLLVLKPGEWVDNILVNHEFEEEIPLDGGLPSIKIIDAAGAAAPFLPKFDEINLWAHVQLTDSIGHAVDPATSEMDNILTPDNATELTDAIANFNTSIEGNPNLGICRIISPRKLEPKETYQAFLVPSYETGRLTGLGADAATVSAIPAQKAAWGTAHISDQYENRFPVYYSWSFATGDEGDFESLVKEIIPRSLSPEIGRRPMDISDPGYGLSYQLDLLAGTNDDLKTTLLLEGALKTPGTTGETYPYEDIEDDINYNPVTDTNFRTQLQDLVNLSEDLISNNGLTNNYYGQVGHEIAGDLVEDDPIIAPPLYGRWHALKNKADANDASTDQGNAGWIHELNLDPRNRVIANVGTEIIKEKQDQLMDEAWDQLGDVLEANKKINWTQFATVASHAIFGKNIEVLPDNQVLSLTGKMKRRLMNSSNTQTHHQDIRESILPFAAEDRAMRRIARPIGPVMRRVDPTQLTNSNADNIFDQLSQSKALSAPDTIAPTVAVTTNLIGMNSGTTTSLGINTASYNFSVTGIGQPQGTPPATNAESIEFTNAISPFGNFFGNTNWPDEPAPPTLPLAAVASDIKTKVNPQNTIPNRTYGNMTANGNSIPVPVNLQPIMAHPKFKRPMYEAIRDLSTDLLIPNLNQVPSNTVSLLETNQKFIEAFMVGLNHEMSRELLWREYPTDQRGTYFRQFWNVNDKVNLNNLSDTDFEENNYDIPEIHTWKNGIHDKELGENGLNVSSDNLVLLIRGNLLKKYPNTVIYAIKADWQRTGTVARYDLPRVPLADTELFPIFSAKVDPDITFLGFGITETEAKGADPSQLAPHNGVPASEADPGYFFVMKERPGQSRFGMDVEPESFPPTPPTWDDLHWGLLNTTETIEVNDLSVQADNEKISDFYPDVSWDAGMNSAKMAMILYQKPVMVSIHAREMLNDT